MVRRSPSAGVWGSPRQRREADLFLADLLGHPAPVIDVTPVRSGRLDQEDWGELVEVCGFFGPNNVRLTEPQIRAAVVAQANAEWTHWHTAGAPRPESDAALFGRLIGYYLTSNADVAPDHVTAIQTAAHTATGYGGLLTATNVAAIATAVRNTRRALLTSATLPDVDPVARNLRTAITQARQGNKDAGIFKSWSAVFVVACVRGAAIAQGLEAVISPGRRHIGRNELLLAAIRHSEYTVEARQRRAAAMPRRRGTYHAFRPSERAPQVGDIIVQDRRPTIAAAAQVMTLAGLPERLLTHGDIVVEVQPAFVVTIGGNLTGPLGDSVRKRRYPLDAHGVLVVDPPQLFAQEDDAGTLPALPLTSTSALDDHSTARSFALLSLIEECAAVPGQPYHGGILT